VDIVTPKFDNLSRRYIEEELSDSQKKKLLALGLGSAMALPGTSHLAQKAGEALRDDPPAPVVQHVDEPDKQAEIRYVDPVTGLPARYHTGPDFKPGPPPAVAGPAPTVATTHGPADSQFDPEFIKYIQRVENSVKRGLKGGKWYPHGSAEGGRKTIAYGHKLKVGEDFSNGITDQEAIQLLIKDLTNHKAGASRIVDRKYGTGTFSKLDRMRQEMLIDIQFNIRGGLNKFTQFMHAVVNNDKEGMIKHHVRKYKHPKTKKWVPIKDRNNQFKKRYLSN
jgi:hypothetical protein